MPNEQKQSRSLIIQIAAVALATAAIVAPVTFGAKHYYDKKQYQAAYEAMQQNHQNELQQKDSEIANIQNGYYPEPDTRLSELPEQLRNLCGKQINIASALHLKADNKFMELWKTSHNGADPLYEYGPSEYLIFSSARHFYCALALGAAGFPRWKHGMIGRDSALTEEEVAKAEQAVRTELCMAPDEPIDFSWIDDFYRNLHASRQAD